MSHRAQQIVDAMAANLAPSTAVLGQIFIHRSLSIAEAANEVPCVAINYGADNPLNALGASNLSFLDSLLEVSITAFAGADSEQALLSTLLDARTLIHKALIGGDRSQGLSFVIDTRYAGLPAPDVGSAAERIFGSLSSNFAVHYRMNMSDPS